MAPSVSGLQSLIDICECFAANNDIIYNATKSTCMIICPKSRKLQSKPIITIKGKFLEYIDSVTYLGQVIPSDFCDELVQVIVYPSKLIG